jgi:acetophenone carboxylase
MKKKMQITETLDIDLEKEMWCCNRCGTPLISAKKNYKEGCLIAERSPLEVHRPLVKGDFNFAPSPEWCRVIEFYCPGCGVMFEVEYLPPGHPITYDIEIDLEELKKSI